MVGIVGVVGSMDQLGAEDSMDFAFGFAFDSAADSMDPFVVELACTHIVAESLD